MWHFISSPALALLFLATGAGKVLGLAFAKRNRDRLGVSPRFWRITGLLEWAGAVGLLVGLAFPPLGFLAASGLAVLMVGAIVTRLRATRLVGVPAGGARGLALPIAGDVLVLALAVLTAVLIGRGV